MTHAQKFLDTVSKIATAIDHEAMDRIVAGLVRLREQHGRLFFLGAGGSAANCTHAVNDFRKLCGIEAYCPTDNVAELTARVNDEGWETVFESYLKISRAQARDAIFIMSVGGGDAVRNISVGIIRAIDYAKREGMKIYGIVGRENCYTKSAGDEVIVIPVPEPGLVTPLAEAFQGVVWHAMVSDPRLSICPTTW